MQRSARGSLKLRATMWQIWAKWSAWMSPEFALFEWGVAGVVVFGLGLYYPSTAPWLPKLLRKLIAIQIAILGSGLFVGWLLLIAGVNPSDAYAAASVSYGASWLCGALYASWRAIERPRGARSPDDLPVARWLRRAGRGLLVVVVSVAVAGAATLLASIVAVFVAIVGKPYLLLTDTALIEQYRPCCGLCRATDELDELARRRPALFQDPSGAVARLRAKLATPDSLSAVQTKMINDSQLNGSDFVVFNCGAPKYWYPEVAVLAALAKRGEPQLAATWLADPKLSAELKTELKGALDAVKRSN